MHKFIFFIFLLLFFFIIINLINCKEYFILTNNKLKTNWDNPLLTNSNSDQYYTDYSNGRFNTDKNSDIDVDYSAINYNDHIYPYYQDFLESYNKQIKNDVFSFDPTNIFWNPQTDNFKNYFYHPREQNYASLKQLTDDAYLYSPNVSQKIICSNYTSQADCWANNKCQWTKPPSNHCEVATTMLL